MTQTNKVDWLLVGAGDIAKKRVAPALNAAANSKIVAVCDVTCQRAQEIAEDFGINEVYTDIDEALSRTKANAVYIATPVFLHTSQAAKALNSGKHVLVEKPLAVNGEEALRLVEISKEKNLRSGCAYFRRCYPCYTQAKEMLEAGEFGQVVLIRMTFFSWANPSADNWRIVKNKSGGGPLSDIGSHMFDVLIGLLGMPKSVYAKCSNLVHKWEVEDSTVIIMTMENGAHVIASFNWNSKTWSHEFEIIGTRAKVKWHPFDSGKVIKTVERDIQELDLPNAENVHSPLIEDFERAIQQEADPVVPLWEAAKTNILLDAVYASSRTGKEVIIKEGF